jgi:PHD/YefM family antitoxin component YafN of YafNO toxin-antitoxin module
MNCEEALVILQFCLEPKSLNDIQEMVFQYAWEGKTYEQIALVLDYDTDYIRHIGSKLWRSLSEALGEKVTKKNFRSVFKRQQRLGKTDTKFSISVILQQDWDNAISTYVDDVCPTSIMDFTISNTYGNTKEHLNKLFKQIANDNLIALVRTKDHPEIAILRADELFSRLETLHLWQSNTLN